MNYSRPSHASELLVSRDGRFVYISNRGHDSIAAFAIDAASGKLECIQHQPSGGRVPWTFALTGDDDAYLVCHNANTRVDYDPAVSALPDQVTVHKRDVESGLLRLSGVSLEYPTVGSVWGVHARI